MKKAVALVLTIAVVFSGCNFFKRDPQKAVNKGIAAFTEVKKMNSKLTLSGTINAPEGEVPTKVQFSLEAVGSSDVSDSRSPKVDMTVKVSGSVDGSSGSGEFLFKTLDKKMFANLTKITISGATGETLSTQLASVLNTWWSIPLNDQNYFGKLTEQQKQLQEKLRTTPFFINAAEMGEEDVSGVKSTRYRVELDKQAVQKFILDIARMGENQLSPEEELAIGDSLKDVEFSGAVWVNDDDAVNRIQGRIVVRPEQGSSTSLDLDYTGWDYGKDVAILAPESPKDFNPLMLLPLFGAFSSIDQSAAETPAGNGAIDAPLGAGQVKP